MNDIVAHREQVEQPPTAVWQKGRFSAKFDGSSSIELLHKIKHLCFDVRHFAKLQTWVMPHCSDYNRTISFQKNKFADNETNTYL